LVFQTVGVASIVQMLGDESSTAPPEGATYRISRRSCAEFCRCVQVSAEKYNGIRFVKEFNTGLMKS
jgi:hypothetical protein